MLSSFGCRCAGLAQSTGQRVSVAHECHFATGDVECEVIHALEQEL